MSGKVTTEAWVLHKGSFDKGEQRPHERLKLETLTFDDIADDEVLVEPIYGCWESNMSHALERLPVDICLQRNEEKVVLGNAGVVRVLKVGSAVSDLAEGNHCIVFANGQWDKHGYVVKVLAYDAPNTLGVLARRTKMHHKNLIPIPKDTPYSLKQWAAFSLRFVTAWANWRVAHSAWRIQMADTPPEETYVWGWGGGSTLAELMLAKAFGCKTAMLASTDDRLAHIRNLGITAIDRREFPGLEFNPDMAGSDASQYGRYRNAERKFLKSVMEHTNGEGVSIFIEYIGTPVFRATLKALSRQGVLTTAGWKCDMKTSIMRAVECINRHTHVHTHYAKYSEGLDAVQYAGASRWMAPFEPCQYDWEDIPKLAFDYTAGNTQSYFPLFAINP